MGRARRPLAGTPGLTFHRLLGSGRGFTVVPDISRYAFLGLWQSEQAADDFFAGSPTYQAWRGRCREHWTVKLVAERSRGTWAGTEMPRCTAALPPSLPVVVLTRASLRLRALYGFWARARAINRELWSAPGLRLALGVGEIPWLRPVTFSVWDDAAALERFAFGDTRHQHAAHTAMTRRWFREDLFARFVAIASQGTVDGRDPCGFHRDSPREHAAPELLP